MRVPTFDGVKGGPGRHDPDTDTDPDADHLTGSEQLTPGPPSAVQATARRPWRRRQRLASVCAGCTTTRKPTL